MYSGQRTSFEVELVLVLVKGNVHEASTETVVGEHKEHVLHDDVHTVQGLAMK